MIIQDVPTERLEQTAVTMRQRNYGKTVQFYTYFTPGAYGAVDFTERENYQTPLTTTLTEIETELQRRKS